MQRLLASLATRVMAPGAVRFEHLSVFWNRPTEIDGLVLRDAQGDDIVVSPHAHFSWSLRQILLTRPASAMLTLDQAAVDIERSASGTVGSARDPQADPQGRAGSDSAGAGR